jgi:hypothetical protein
MSARNPHTPPAQKRARTEVTSKENYTWLADDIMIAVNRLPFNSGDTTHRFYWNLVGYKGKQPGIPTSTFRARYYNKINGKLFAEADKGRFLSAISKDNVA